MSWYKEYGKPTVVLTVIAVLVVFAVTTAYRVTKPYIDKASNQAAYEAAKAVLPQAESFEEITVDENVMSAHVCTFLRRASDKSGMAIQIQTRGYQDGLTVMVGVLRNGTISGVRVVSHAETENIGTRAMEESYLTAYAGKTETSGIAMLSGATYTSEGIRRAVDNALALFEEVKGDWM